METIRLVVWLLITAIAVASAVFALRLLLRHQARNYRERLIGTLRWYMLTGESQFSEEVADLVGQVNAVKGFLTNLTAATWPYNTRGIASFIWNREQDGLLRLYVGLDDTHTSNGSVVRLLANGLHCVITECAGPPAIPTDSLVVAHRVRQLPSDVVPVPSAAGSIATALSELHDHQGAVIMTVEFMRSSESHRFEANVAEEAIMRGGDASRFSGGVGNQARTMVDSGVRMCLGAVSADGNVNESVTILRTAVGAISSLGYRLNAVEPLSTHVKQTMIWSGLATALSLLSEVLGWTDRWAGMVPLLVSAGVLLAVIMRPQLLGGNQMKERLAQGEIVVPSFIYWSARWKLHGAFRGGFRTDAGGDTTMGNRVSPPSCKQVLVGYGASVTEFVSFPQLSRAENVAVVSTPQIGIPSHFEITAREDDVFYGRSGRDQLVSYPLTDLQYPLFVAGSPGSGKTNFLQVVYTGVAWACRKNYLNLSITPIWGETKGQGAYDTWKLVRDVPGAIFIDTHNPFPGGFRLALEGKRLSEGATVREVIENAENLTSGFQFAYGEGIMANSREALLNALRISLLLNAHEIRFLELERLVAADKPNIVSLSHLILGGNASLNPGPKLVAMMKDLESSTDERDRRLYESIANLSVFLSGKSRGSDERWAPARNKLSDIRNLETFWDPSPDRQDVYVSQLPGHFAPIVLNLGPYWDAEKGEFSQRVSAKLASDMLRCTSYVLWNRIKSACSGWDALGRRVVLFFDEVADVATNSESDQVANVLADISKEGRSRGTSVFCATQNLAQLPFQAAHEVMAYTNKVFFRLPEAEDRRQAIESLGRMSQFTESNLINLPQGTGIAVLRQGDQVTPPFTLLVPYAPLWSASLQTGDRVQDAAARFTDQDNRARSLR